MVDKSITEKVQWLYCHKEFQPIFCHVKSLLVAFSVAELATNSVKYLSPKKSMGISTEEIQRILSLSNLH
jgi:hypothetical protein